MSNEKTIRMPRELLDKWLAALRSGEYKQATHRLEVDGAYCCLGVLQHAVDGDVERYASGRAWGLPSDKWMHDHKVVFLDDGGEKDCAPWLHSLNMFAHTANDHGRHFAEIADAIEACAEGV